MTKRTPIALTADAVITVGFYTKNPLIVMILRGIEPYKGMLALPGGHFESGIWDKANEIFWKGKNDSGITMKCDASLKHTCSRETMEEITAHIPPEKWQELMILDSPDRDPRPDSRRVSVAYWVDFPYREALGRLRARDDASEVLTIPLLGINSWGCAFDHFLIIDELCRNHGKLRQTWTKHRTKGYQHLCAQMPDTLGSMSYMIVWTSRLPSILFGSDRRIPSKTETIYWCPWCGADLTLPPFK